MYSIKDFFKIHISLKNCQMGKSSLLFFTKKQRLKSLRISVFGKNSNPYFKKNKDLSFCRFLPVFAGFNRFFPLSRQKYFLPWQKPNPAVHNFPFSTGLMFRRQSRKFLNELSSLRLCWRLSTGLPLAT